jgi:hypothetical protein
VKSRSILFCQSVFPCQQALTFLFLPFFLSLLLLDVYARRRRTYEQRFAAAATAAAANAASDSGGNGGGGSGNGNAESKRRLLMRLHTAACGELLAAHTHAHAHAHTHAHVHVHAGTAATAGGATVTVAQAAAALRADTPMFAADANVDDDDVGNDNDNDGGGGGGGAATELVRLAAFQRSGSVVLDILHSIVTSTFNVAHAFSVRNSHDRLFCSRYMTTNYRHVNHYRYYPRTYRAVVDSFVTDAMRTHRLRVGSD